SADALEYFANFAKGPDHVWDETMPPSTIAFAGGNLAMYFAPSWRAMEIKQVNPLLNFQVAPVPQLEGSQVTWASYWAEGVSAKSAHKKEAWEFIKFMQEDENLVKLYSEASRTPGRFFGEPYPKVPLAAQLVSDPIVGAYIKDAPYMRSFPMASRTFDNGLLETTAKNVAQILARFGAN
ncbi:MAG: extracellular solute-binding protein, partial [Candidatus Curtissbacteria bacterium GW2011_GWB1_40_28]